MGILAPQETRATLTTAADRTAAGAERGLQWLRARMSTGSGDAPAAKSGADSGAAAGETGDTPVAGNTSAGAVPPERTAPAHTMVTPPALGFANSVFTVAPTDVAARIVIQRTGGLGQPLDFVWWTEAASAKPGVDYASLGRRHERMAAGQDTLTVYVPIVTGSRSRDSATFYVALNGANGPQGNAVEQRAMVVVGHPRS
jgi:hypothetical protein